MDPPVSPAPLSDARPELLPAYVANGCIGLRVPRLAVIGGMAIVNGYSAIDASTLVEGSAPVPYPLTADIQINGVSLHLAQDQAEFESQSYDFSSGEVTTEFAFVAAGIRCQVSVLTFCSRSMPWLVLQQVALRVDAACDLSVKAMIDPAGVPGSWLSRLTDTPGTNEAVADGSMLWLSPGGLSTCGAAFATTLEGTKDAERVRDRWDEDQPLSTSYRFHARTDRTYTMTQMTAMMPSSVHRQPDRACVRTIADAKERGFDQLRRENRREWSELWQGRIRVDSSDPRWQAMSDAAFFYLHSSVHSSSPSSTSMFGLTRWHNYHYYRGHVMWDIEAFCLPPLLFTYPPAAESLLGFRARGIDAAWMNARIHGYTGLQYPWEAGPVAGEEAAPGGGAAANREHHVSMSVAMAFVRHFYATGDELYLRDKGWPVIQGVADWLTSRVEQGPDGSFEIRRVGGVAEKREPVNNNAFVNMTAILCLRAATELADVLGYRPRERWEQVASCLRLPRSSQGHIPNHDDYTPQEEKGETPETLAGLFPFDFSLEAATERRTIEYFLRLAPRYVGAPMLSSTLGVFAARIGDRRQSLKLFEDGYASFQLEPFAMTDEYWSKKFPEMPRAGPFLANIGGFISSLLLGLPGIETNSQAPASWCRRPVVLPAGWRSIEVERLWVRGEPHSLRARHGDERALLRRAP